MHDINGILNISKYTHCITVIVILIENLSQIKEILKYFITFPSIQLCIRSVIALRYAYVIIICFCICTGFNPRILFGFQCQSVKVITSVIKCNYPRVINAEDDGIRSETNRKIDVYFLICRGTQIFSITPFSHKRNYE